MINEQETLRHDALLKGLTRGDYEQSDVLFRSKLMCEDNIGRYHFHSIRQLKHDLIPL